MSATNIPPGVEWPPKFDLRKDIYEPLPKIAPGTVDPATMAGDAPTIQAQAALDAVNAALASNDEEKLAECFFTEQAFWRDIVAFTAHLRTFMQAEVVAAALLRMKGLRELDGRIELEGEPHFVVMSPMMMFIDCGLTFCTRSPALYCAGKMVLLPVKSAQTNKVSWKIWVLSTWVENVTKNPEDEALLLSPGKNLHSICDTIETDVVIVGAGTSGLMMAARLKAMGVDSVVIDRNAEVGENWGKRYDRLQFHVPTSNCEMPFLPYKKELYSPHRLTKDEVAEHVKLYADKFHLNTMLSTAIHSSLFNSASRTWTVKVKTADASGHKTIIAKHFVQATGIGSGKPNLPSIRNPHLYTGISLHSTQFRNAKSLAKQGVTRVAIIGSANTAFDILRDCHEAGLQPTMIARSPTYIFPYSYVMDPHGIGAYDLLPLKAADRMLNTFPLALDGQFSHGLFAHLALQEPDRYTALAKAGFPVLDSNDPSVDVQHHLVERGGGHYIDTGDTDLIASGKVAVRGLVEPVSYTKTGLALSDGSELDVDAVVWCTGFTDKDVRATAESMLGVPEEEHDGEDSILGPKEIAARLDATWGVDSEGEVRGMWKRHLRMENYWVIGGVIQHQRWWSKALAVQIRLALDGQLPDAYRDIPEV